VSSLSGIFRFDAPDLSCGVARIKPVDTIVEIDEHAGSRSKLLEGVKAEPIAFRNPPARG
jgi:hypothetical protein